MWDVTTSIVEVLCVRDVTTSIVEVLCVQDVNTSNVEVLCVWDVAEPGLRGLQRTRDNKQH